MIMNEIKEHATVKVPITQRDRALAEQYSQGINPQQAKRIYCNFLAVRVMEFYFNCLGIKINPKQSDTYNPLLLKFFDTADLWIENYGRIETRPLFPKETSYLLPPEVRFDRKSYFLVRLDSQLTQGEILGFTPTAKERIRVQELRSLHEFPAYFNQSSLSCLGNWLKGIIEKEWQTLDNFLTSQSLTPSTVRHISSPKATIKQAKIINLGVQLDDLEILLAITVVPNVDNTIKVRVQVFPVSNEPYLPEQLQLAMLSETGEILQEVRSRRHDNYIQLRSFRGTSGDRFDIQLELNHVKVVESFVF